MDLSRYLTTKEVAARLGVTLSRVRQLVMDSRLASKKIGRDHYFRESDVDQLHVRPYRKRPYRKRQET